MAPTASAPADGIRPVLVVLSPDWVQGGVESVTAKLLAQLVPAADVRVLITTGGLEGPPLPDEVDVEQLQLGRSATSGRALYSSLRRHRPTAVLTVKDHLSVVAVPVARAAGVRRVVPAVHVAFRRRGEHRRGLGGAVLPAAMAASYRAASGIVAVSAQLGSDLAALRLPPDRIHVIPNPVIDEKLCTAADRPIAQDLLPHGEAPLVVAAGRLSPDKDFATLIRAVSATTLRLLLLGEGPERERLDALVRTLGVAGRCSLPGHVPDAAPYLARADVVALSSRREGLPTVLVEALALGRPVVSTDCPTGPRELLEGGRFGALCPIGDPAAFARALERAAAAGPPAERPDLRAYTVEASGARYAALLGLGGDR